MSVAAARRKAAFPPTQVARLLSVSGGTPGRGGRGSNRRDPSELAPFPTRPRSRAFARVEMPPSGVVAAGKPLGLTETGSRELGATTGWRRHINGWAAEPVHVEPCPEFVNSQSPARDCELTNSGHGSTC